MYGCALLRCQCCCRGCSTAGGGGALRLDIRSVWEQERGHRDAEQYWRQGDREPA